MKTKFTYDLTEEVIKSLGIETQEDLDNYKTAVRIKLLKSYIKQDSLKIPYSEILAALIK